MPKSDNSEHKVPLVKSFIRAQFTSIAASLTDIGSLFLFTEYGGIYYLISTALASTCGAIVGFFLGRHWTFERSDQGVWGQALKYGIASIIIMLCNVAGMYLLTDGLDIQYMGSKLIISILIGLCVSFPLFRYWVYK